MWQLKHYSLFTETTFHCSHLLSQPWNLMKSKKSWDWLALGIAIGMSSHLVPPQVMDCMKDLHGSHPIINYEVGLSNCSCQEFKTETAIVHLTLIGILSLKFVYDIVELRCGMILCNVIISGWVFLWVGFVCTLVRTWRSHSPVSSIKTLCKSVFMFWDFGRASRYICVHLEESVR